MAGLTILKAYIEAGRPPQDIPRWGGFEEWSYLIRSALVWLGCADPYLTKRKIDLEDPDKTSLKVVLKLWEPIYGNEMKKASELASDCNKAIASGENESDRYELAQAFMEVTTNRSKLLDSISLGYWLRRNKDRIMDGHKIIKCPSSSVKSIGNWQLVKA
jgi:putative DNA primase/helicase